MRDTNKGSTARRHSLWLLVLPLLLVLPSASAFAGAEGRLSGTIVDENGKGIDGVQVTLIVLDTEKSEIKETNKKGRFSFLVVDSTARFGLRMEKSGFMTLQEGIDIQAGGTTRLEWVMKEGSTLEAAPGTAPEAPPVGSAAAIDLYNAAATLYNEGDRAGAVAQFQAALAEDPTLAAAHKAIAEVYLAENSTAEAVASAQKYYELEPDSADAISLLYDALKTAGRAEEGAALLDQLVEKDPSPATAKRLFNMALESSKKGQLEGALAGFTRALAVDPSLGQGYLGLADTYLRMGRYDEALEQAEKANTMLPDNIGVPLVQYQAYRRKGDADAAQSAFALVREKNPSRAAVVLYDEGKALFEANAIDEALPLFESVLEMDSSHPDATYMLGLCKLNQSAIDEAKPLLQRFIELAPDHPDAATARQMLSAL